MEYILFLDDIRFPVDAKKTFSKDEFVVIARNMDDAVWYVQRYGIPYQIHFDHDLADEHYGKDTGEKTGYTFAKWFCGHVMDNDLTLPDNFYYHVHSLNPVGSENIRKYMDNFLEYIRD